MPVAEPRVCFRCSPHEDSALCVAFSDADPNLLATGGGDSVLLLHDIRCCFSSSSALSSAPASSTSSSSSKTSFRDPVAALSWQSENVLYVASGKRVHLIDVRKIMSSSSSSHSTPSSSSSSSFAVILEADDDVSSLSVSRDLKTLAVADDSGTVTLVDLPPGAERSTTTSTSTSTTTTTSTKAFPPSRRLPASAHGGSVATAACFRPNRSGESLVTGGCDCTLARWDRSCSGRLVRRWQASEIVAQQQQEGEEEEESFNCSSSRLFNPPFVHSLAVPSPLALFSTPARKPWNALVAAAIGEGSVAVLDCDAAAATAAAATSADASRRRRQQQKLKQNQKQKEERSPPFDGVLAVLRREDGGHTAAATCVTFVDDNESGNGSRERKEEETRAATTAAAADAAAEAPLSPPPLRPPTLLASGGDDGRVLFWRWAAKAVSAGGRQLPPSWSAALAPFHRGIGGGGDNNGDAGPFPFLAAATPKGAKLQALASRRGLVAAADTSTVVKLYKLE